MRCVFLFSLLLATTAAQAAGALWQDVDQNQVQRTAADRQIVPERYRTVRLDLAEFERRMQRVPGEASVRPQQSSELLELPMPDGSTARFAVVETALMAPELAKKYPVIRTWAGQGVDDPTATLHYDLTHKGFHAQVLSADGTVFIDPYQPGDREHYISYYKRDHHHGERIRCGVTGEALSDESMSEHLKHAVPKASAGANVRTYRLAVTATGEYTAFHGGGVVDGLAGIVTTMNRVSGIYEREVSVRFQLIANNDVLVFTNAATDPWSNTSSDLNSITGQLNTRVGSANYDVGHLVGTNGGGVAGLGVICGASKGRGLTGSSSPVGDGFDVDYVAHEMGHQFGGNHTFNGSGSSCGGGNRNGSTAYEPGSGSTIQAYAGICAADNLQPNSDDYFHRVSLNEIIAHTTSGSGGNCGTLTPTGNSEPTVTALTTGLTIPKETPFELDAQGTDADGDVLTYTWEHFDLGAANSAGSLADNGARPLFRSFPPSRESRRIFPSLRYILDNANVVPATAALPGTSMPYFTGERLPTMARTAQFRVTVRDNRVGGGGTNEASATLTVSAAAGPFRITAPESAVTWAAGSTQTVTWDVAGTNAGPVNASQVRIDLSLDGGYTWPIELAANEANDGSASVVIPAGTPATSRARIKVKAVGNVFFDISGTDFTITSANSAPQIAGITPLSIRQGSPAATAQVATVSDAQDAAAALQVVVADVPDDMIVSVLNDNGNVRLTAEATCELVAPTAGERVYPLRLQVTDSDGAMASAFVNVNVSANQTPTLGTYASAEIPRSATLDYTPSVPVGDPNGNFASLGVSPTTLPGGGTISVDGNGVVTVTTTASTSLGTYPVRVQAMDTCGAAEIRTFDVIVAVNEAVLEVASATVESGNGLIEPSECNEVSLSLANIGTMTATGVTATVSTSHPGVTLGSATVTFPDIPAGQTRAAQVPLEVSTDGALVCHSEIPFDVQIGFTGGTSPVTDSFVLAVGEVATNYVFTADDNASIPTGGSRISGSNVDEAMVTVTVPFAFSLYGTSYPANQALRASTNGTLQFQATGGATAYENAALPSGSFTSPTLMPFWDDLRLDTSGGGIYTYTQGAAPARTFTIVWRGQSYSNSVVPTNTVFAVVLKENSGDFEFHYGQTAAGGSLNGGSATIGVQADATRYTQYSFNQPTVVPGRRLLAAMAPGACNAGFGGCNAEPQVVVSQSGGSTAVVEGGATDNYQVVLTKAPSGNVTVTPVGDSQVQVSGALTFTTLNWNVPQTVTVTAVDDRTVEGAHGASIAHSVSGGGYDGVTAPEVIVQVGDNDSASYHFASASQTVDESIGSANVGVVLDFATSGSGPQALASAITVPVSTSGSATSPADYSLGAASVTFPVSGDAQSVSLIVVDDAIVEGNETVALMLGAATGGSAALHAVVTAAPPATHTVTLQDNEVPVLIVTESAGDTLVGEGGASDSYTIALSHQPSGPVIVSITPDAQLQVSPGSLTFSVGNWSVPQTVTVTAVDDDDEEGSHTGIITHSAVGGGYAGASAPAIVVTIADNDGPSTEVDLALTVTRQKGAVLPGGTVSFEVAVANLSSTSDVDDAQFEFAFTPGLGGVEWTCVADNGADCPASGTGEPSHAITLPRNSGVIYLVSGQVAVDAEQGSTITADASIEPRAPLTDPDTANNAAQATATVDGSEVFYDGFEAE